MHMLLIEDNSAMAVYVGDGLRREGFVVDHAKTAADGLRYVQAFEYDLVICDVGLPDMSGFELVETLRETDSRTPILFLSAKDMVNDRVKGLEIGGDDYLTKPFSFSELLARCQALMRRSRPTQDDSVLRVADLKMDLSRHKVYRGAKEIYLQPLEFRLLQYLMHSKGRVLSKNLIMERIWGDQNFDPDTNVVEVRMHHLRNKVDKPFDHALIHTVRGVGYVLDDRDILKK